MGRTHSHASASRTWTHVATLLAGILIGAALPALTARAAPGEVDAETRAALVAVKQGIVAGHKAKDPAALDRLYADDYTAVDTKGETRTKGDLLQSLPTDADIADGTYELIAFRRWGDTAVASGHGHLVYRNPDGSTRVSDYDSVNVFQRRAGRWLYVAAFLP